MRVWASIGWIFEFWIRCVVVSGFRSLTTDNGNLGSAEDMVNFCQDCMRNAYHTLYMGLSTQFADGRDLFVGATTHTIAGVFHAPIHHQYLFPSPWRLTVITTTANNKPFETFTNNPRQKRRHAKRRIDIEISMNVLQ